MKRRNPLKRWMSIVLASVLIIFVLVGTTGCGDSAERIDWSKMKLGALLPEPKASVGEIWDNTDEELDVRLNNFSEDEYSEYVKACETKGYTIDVDKRNHAYEAYNENGYKLQVDLVYEKMSVELHAPMAFSAIEWPASELGRLVPAPKSLMGKFEFESANDFLVYVGETTKEEYNEYVKACAAAGFDVDYDKGDHYYRADNTDGYHISLEYEGFNTMSVRANEPDKKDASKTTSVEDFVSTTDHSAVETTTPAPVPTTTMHTEANSTDVPLVNGMRKEFKDAMDVYESFIDDYVAFMKKYKSNPTDTTLLADYAKWISDYSDMASTFDKWENEELNNAELSYYVEVQTRASQKILESAAN